MRGTRLGVGVADRQASDATRWGLRLDEMMSERTPQEDLLVGGLDDWVDAGWAMQSARLAGASDGVELRDATLALIEEVLREGLMVAGDVTGGVHVPWPVNPQEAADRIRRDWLAKWGDEVPTPGAIVWLSNTTKGDDLARSVLIGESRA